MAMVDGRAIYADYMGFVFWDAIPTSFEDVKQVEVIRGPGSAVWGANAMNGVVNIITKPPREMLGTTFTIGIGTFGRSGGAADSDRGSLYYMSASHAEALNDHLAFKITGGAYTQDPFARPQGTIPNPYNTPYPPYTNKSTTQPKVDGRVDYDFPDGKQHLTFSGAYMQDSGIFINSFGPWSLYDCSGGYGKMDYMRGALRITGYVNVTDWKSVSLLYFNPAGQPIPGDGENQTYHFEFGDSRTVREKHLISYGASFRHNKFNLAYAPEGKKRDEGGAYIQDEIIFSEHLRWIVGTRVDRFDNLKDVVFSPRTTFIVKPVPGQTFRVSYNRAYMAPFVNLNYMSLSTLQTFDLGLIVPQLAGNYFSFPMNMEGNRNLKEQSLNAYEVGYTTSIAKSRVSLGAAFYINDSKGDFYWPQTASYTSLNPPPGWPLPPSVLDLLIAANAFGPGMGLPSLYTSGNLGKVRNKGLELSADMRINRYVTGYANYSWQAQPVPKGFDISLINLPPASRFNAGTSFDYRRYLGNLSVGYVASAYWNDMIAIYNGPTQAYTVVNAGGGIRWGSGEKYTAVLKISNLANTPIQNHVFGDILKRQISGEFRVLF